MSLIETKKSPLVALPFLKKRLRRITALGLRKLDIKDLSFAVFFTLHRNEKTVAFYTSESIENQRSPEWSYLKFPFNVQCLEDFFLRVWIKCGNQCRLFLEYDIHLDQSLIPDVQKTDSASSHNSLWIEMFGYRFSDDESNEPKIESIPIEIMTTNSDGKKSNSKRIQHQKSYTELSIIRMMTIINAILGAKSKSKDYLGNLQKLVDANDKYLSEIKERESQQLYIERLREFLQCRTSIFQEDFQNFRQRQNLINERKENLSRNLTSLLNQKEELKSRNEVLRKSKLTLNDLVQLIVYRQKLIVRDIYTYVYPIKVENKTDLTIANVKLPAAEDKIFLTSLSREKLYEIEASVGFCAHLVLIISQFIQLPLRFPIEFNGSPTVKIHDHNLTSTNFSLDFSSKNEVFPYAFFLLNRNIGQILEHFHIGNRNTDYRRSLENLKEVLDKCFVPTSISQKIETKTLNHQVSSQIPIPFRKLSTFERSSRNSTLTPVFRSISSSKSSLDEINAFDQSEQTDREIDLFPRTTTISPRLTMQFSLMQQK